MTAPQPPSTAVPWYTRPPIVLPLVGTLILLAALLAPQATVGRGGDPRLSSYSSAPMGGKIFFETANRLGWRVAQSKSPAWPADTGVVVAVLAPVVPIKATDVHALLERVRHGGALLLALGDGGRLLADSLRVTSGPDGVRVVASKRDAADCAADRPSMMSTRFIYTLWPGDRVLLSTLSWRGPHPDSVTTLVEVDEPPRARHDGSRATAVGFPYGRGRVVVSADPDVMRNDAVRICKYGLDVASMGLLEYAGTRADGTRRAVVFDEYHQGYGEQQGTMSAVASYLVGTSSGRLLFQMLAAGLVLLLAAAPRLIPPRDPLTVERRSPLEHVDALGRAYAQVGATKSATARLVRGVRRRLSGGTVRSGGELSDDAFLDRALREAPQLAAEVALIKRALHAPLPRRDFSSVGAALEQLELSLTRI
jgi:hypothetical protein